MGEVKDERLLEIKRALEQNSRLLHKNIALERENEKLKSEVEMLRGFAELVYDKYDELTSSIVSAVEKIGAEHDIGLPDGALEAARQEMALIRVSAKLLNIDVKTR